MQKLQAQNIVKETFEKPFEKDRFVRFIKELLNHIEESPFVYRGNLIPDAYEKYIGTFERVGKYSDGETKVDILIVNLKKETSLERARTAQRNFIAWYLNGSRGGEMKDAALVAFVSPNDEDWRFSLVKMEYKFTEGKAGKIKVKEEFTPAKRWSFLVGKNESSHTAQSRLVPIIEDDANNPTLKHLEDAFNIEKVTKEFFEKYRDLFLRVKESLDDWLKKDKDTKNDFETKGVNTVDFTKKLLGQIVFLYFLQKKGWFGVRRGEDWGFGSKRFLRDLFDGKIIPYNNFFNDVLEHLFYDALARDRSDIDHWNDHFKCKIPFLNGGLFDPLNGYGWEKTDILLPNDLFSNNRKDTKTGDIGDGILDIFDRYNFTVKEDEPLEKEVAVDPEMLGKVFENLLEVKDRKSKGTYYTPREIVHYMCQESLVNYLVTELDDKVKKEDVETLIKYGETSVEHDVIYIEKKSQNTNYKGLYKQAKLPKSIEKYAELIDEKLKTIRICDPAVGSGAFPVGMMNEIVRTRNALTSYLKTKKGRTIYDFKRHAIQNSLYGVDIDLGAVEIAKLRLWLSLIVDEEDIEQIKPLPNLDYKIMQGNSLLEEFEGVKLFDERLLNAVLEDNSDKIQRIDEQLSTINGKLLKFYQKKPEWMRNKSVERPSELAALENEQKRLMDNLKYEKDKGRVNIKDVMNSSLFSSEKKSESIWELLTSLHKEFFEETQKKNKDDFKKRIEDLEWELIEATLKEQNKTSALKKLEQFKKSNTKPFFLWKLHFAEVFEEKGGFDVVIANPPYIGEKGHKEIFQEIKKDVLGNFYQGKMDIFYFFFHLALNLSHQSSEVAFITTNYYITATGAAKLRKDFKERSVIQRLINFNELKLFEAAQGQHNMVTILRKGQVDEAVAKTAITKRKGLATAEILQKILNWQNEETDYYEARQKDLYDGDEYYIRLTGNSEISDNPIQKILDKVKKQGRILGVICNVNQGIVTGADKVSNKHIKKYGIRAEVGEGIFVLSDKEIADFKFSASESKLLKPWFKNSDIYRWTTLKNTKERVIYSNSETINNIKDLPKLERHLTKFKKIISVYAYRWHDLHRSRHMRLFEGKKIVVPQRSPRNTFGYNEIPWYTSADVYFITEKDKSISLKYVLALLNSKLYYLWLYQRGKRKGEMLELYQKPLSEIPIKKVSESEQKPFSDLVDKILAITKDENYLENLAKQAKVREYEKQIDRLVYKLYGLTPEEIKIVENSKK